MTQRLRVQIHPLPLSIGLEPAAEGCQRLSSRLRTP